MSHIEELIPANKTFGLETFMVDFATKNTHIKDRSSEIMFTIKQFSYEHGSFL